MCLEPGALTVVVGPNGCGKTSLFEAPGLVAKLELPSRREVRRGYRRVEVRARLELRGGAPDNDALDELVEAAGFKPERLEVIVSSERSTLRDDRLVFAADGYMGGADGMLVFSVESGEGLWRVGPGVVGALRRLLSSTIQYVPSHRRPDDLLSVSSSFGRLLYVHYPRPEVYQRLVSWIGGMGRYTDMRVVPEDSRLTVELFDGYSGAWVDIRLAAGGLQRALPILLALAAAPEGSVVAVDDAELGLHPAAQLRLAEAIIETVKRGMQVILSTHSPALLTALSIHADRERIEGKLVIACRDQRDVKLHHTSLRLRGELPPDVQQCLGEMGAVGLFGEEASLILEAARHA